MKKNLFKAGNKAAEKWTVEEVTKKLQKIWETLIHPELLPDGKPIQTDNFVKRNKIKTLIECLLMNGLTKWWWHDIKTRYRDIYKTAKTAKPRNGASSVLRLMNQIEMILEARHVYSGTQMDIFVMKNQFGYSDQTQVDHTTKGKELQPEIPKGITIIPASSMTPEQIEKYLQGYGSNQSGGGGNGNFL